MATVNRLGDLSVSFSVADRPSGKSVSMARFAPAAFHSAVEGAYRFTHSRSPDW